MFIEECWQKFAEQMSMIHLYRRTIDSTFKKQIIELCQYENKIKENESLLEGQYSSHVMGFPNLTDGNPVFYARHRLSNQDRTLMAFFHKNKQYQWLLAEAYEAFEDFIEDIYAHLGMSDLNYWPMEDFGNIHLCCINKADFTWFKSQAESKKGGPNKILSQFREKYKELATIEKNNAFWKR